MGWTWNLFDAFGKNWKNGYQFGDILKSLAGIYDEFPASSSGGASSDGSMHSAGSVPSDAVGNSADGVGGWFNDVTGVTASNQFNAQQAQINRDWETQERLASQEFNSAEAEKARQFSKMMEDTRYQRTFQDMMAAGVNPMAAFMSGSASGISGAGSTAAATSSAGSGSSAGSSGNSASAVSGIIRALAGLVKVVK